MKSILLNEEFTIPLYPVEISDLIEREFEVVSYDRRSKEYKQWKKQMNELMKEYNRLVGFKAYIDFK